MSERGSRALHLLRSLRADQTDGPPRRAGAQAPPAPAAAPREPHQPDARAQDEAAGVPPGRLAESAPAQSARDDRDLPLPRDLDGRVLETIRAVEHATMTSAERLAALVQAVEWIDRRGVPGAVVECGVWRGGSMMAAARTLLRLGERGRELYLYDTFAGMTEPQEVDRSYDGSTAEEAMHAHDPSAASMQDWCNAGLEEVRRNMDSTGYPPALIHYVVGSVEETIPATLPGPIALLRLDTDFYSSTRQELAHLYPLVASGGVVIIDDYGAWQGARRAVDEFLSDRPELYLHRIDVTGRILIKP